MASIWISIKELNDLDKKALYETIDMGISPVEAYKLWAGGLAFQGINSYPAKVRRGEEEISRDVIDKVRELEKKFKENGIMPKEI
jgi:hypothetical protein